MVIGVLKLQLTIPENHSLKGKRSVLKRIQSRVAHQFTVAVTECGDQDLWQSAVIGVSAVGTSSPVVEATLQNIVEFIDGMGLAQVGQCQSEILHY